MSVPHHIDRGMEPVAECMGSKVPCELSWSADDLPYRTLRTCRGAPSFQVYQEGLRYSDLIDSAFGHLPAINFDGLFHQLIPENYIATVHQLYA